MNTCIIIYYHYWINLPHLFCILRVLFMNINYIYYVYYLQATWESNSHVYKHGKFNSVELALCTQTNPVITSFLFHMENISWKIQGQ